MFSPLCVFISCLCCVFLPLLICCTLIVFTCPSLGSPVSSCVVIPCVPLCLRQVVQCLFVSPVFCFGSSPLVPAPCVLCYGFSFLNIFLLHFFWIYWLSLSLLLKLQVGDEWQPEQGNCIETQTDSLLDLQDLLTILYILCDNFIEHKVQYNSATPKLNTPQQNPA